MATRCFTILALLYKRDVYKNTFASSEESNDKSEEFFHASLENKKYLRRKRTHDRGSVVKPVTGNDLIQRTHRPCVSTHRYSSRCTTTDAQTVRPYKSLLVSLYYNGRTDRASLQIDVLLYYNGRTDRASLHIITRLAVLQRTHRPCVPTGRRPGASVTYVSQ